jgi:acyl-CoA synthetase (AMP-forming)/AMP-acid ligase II
MENPYAGKPWLKSYDKEVSPSLNYPSISYGEFIRRSFDKVPGRAALIYMGRTITFRELDVLSNQFACYLKKQGLGKGDVVAVHTLNVPAGFIAMAGIQKVGCVYSGVNGLLKPEEIEYQLNDSGAKALVTMDIFYEKVAKIIDRTNVRTILVTSPKDYLPGSASKPADLGLFPGIEVKPFAETIEGMPEDPVTDTVDPDSPCLMMYTGGTTGPPKGAVLTHNNLVHHIVQMSHWFGMGIGEYVYLCAFPIFHQAGNFIAMWQYAIGATNVLVPNPRDFQFIISAMKNYKPSAIANVPTIYLELMKIPEFKGLDFSSVNWFMSGASPFPAENIREFEAIVGIGKLVEVCGMTETSPVLTALPYRGVKKVGSIGIPLSDTEIKLVDPGTNKIVPIGEAGEFVAKGPQVFTKGYHNKPEETANTLRDSWIHTGDVCVMDEDGYFYIVDRLKDMVSVSGFKVFTRQVDDILIEHPDVDVAATVGIPDPKRPGSEIVASAIILKPGREKDGAMREKILAYMKEKVAPYKVPKVIQFMDQLPMSSVGKILKRELRAMLRAS